MHNRYNRHRGVSLPSPRNVGLGEVAHHVAHPTIAGTRGGPQFLLRMNLSISRHLDASHIHIKTQVRIVWPALYVQLLTVYATICCETPS